MTKKSVSKKPQPSSRVQDVTIDKRRRYLERLRDENSLLGAMLVLAVVAILLVNTLFWTQFTRQRNQQEQSRLTVVSRQTIRTSLQTAQNFAATVSVRNVGEDTKVDHAFPISEDQKLLTMQITVKNNTDKPQQLFPVNHLYVRTEQGDFARLQASSYQKRPLQAQKLNPAQAATGEISFALSKQITKPLLYIDTGWDASTPIVISVTQ